MKRILSLIMGMMLVSTMSFAQFSADFEDGLAGFEVLGAGGQEAVEVVANPDGDGQVLKVTKGPQVWSGTGNVMSGYVKYSSVTDTIVTFMFMGDNACKIDVGFEWSGPNGYTNNAYAPTAEYTDAGNWQEISVVIKGGKDRNQDKLIIKPDGDLANGEGSVWYIDDVSFEMELEELPYDPSDVSFTLNVEGADLDDPAMTYIKEGHGQTWADEIEVPALDGSQAASLDTGSYLVRVYDGEEIKKDSVGLTVIGWGDPIDVSVTIFNLPQEDGTATAVMMENPITIDGEAEAAWDGATAHYVAHTIAGSVTDLAYFKLGWDMDNLYVLNVVMDKEIGVTETLGSTWNGDNVELFFDMDQLELGAGEMTSDNITGPGIWQLRYLPIEGNEIWDGQGYLNADNVFTGLDDWSAVSSTVDRTVVVTEGEKYVMEWAIPWSTLMPTFFALEGSEFNFDVGVGDAQEAGGTRNSIAAWNSAEATGDVNYQYTEEYGTVTLGPASTGVYEPMEAINMKLYPSPATSQITIQGVEVVRAEIYDVVGHKVMDVQNNNIINISDLNRGVYMIIVNEETTGKFMVE